MLILMQSATWNNTKYIYTHQYTKQKQCFQVESSQQQIFKEELEMVDVKDFKKHVFNMNSQKEQRVREY